MDQTTTTQEPFADHTPTDKLKDKVTIITDASEIGKAIAVLFAKEGSHIVLGYKDDSISAAETQTLVTNLNRRCIILAGDLADPVACKALIEKAIAELGNINIVINNAVSQTPEADHTNIEAMFNISKEAIPHLHEGDSIINTSFSKDDVMSFTRSLSLNLADKKIRVNAVAPEGAGNDAAYTYLFLASNDSGSTSGEILSPNNQPDVTT